MQRDDPMFMLTASGAAYVLDGPSVWLGNPPDLGDIAHHLAMINRFNGATSRPYSVAEHSLLVERIGAARGASPGLRLALLMHDAHEAYVGDMISPAKWTLGAPWEAFEGAHKFNVRRHFGLRTGYAAWGAEVQACDLIALATERRDLMPWRAGVHAPWPILDTPGREVLPAGERLAADESGRTWREWRDLFVATFHQLRGQMAARHEAAAA